MKNKTLSALWIALCLALVGIGVASADVPVVSEDFFMLMEPANARLVQGLALLDGSAAYVSIWQDQNGTYYLDLTAIGEFSEIDTVTYKLHGDTPPVAVQISACGNDVHAFVETDRIEYYRFSVGVPIASCRDYSMFFPMVVEE